MSSARLATVAIVSLALILPIARAADDGQSRRDPLRPPGRVQATTGPAFDASAWKLVSTLVAAGRRVAIINGLSVRAGDRVGGARVLAIEPGRVRLDYRGRKFTVTRPGTRVRMREHDGGKTR